MQSKNNVVPGLAALKVKRVLSIVSMLAVFLLVSLSAPQATAQQAFIPFEATFDGDFGVAGFVGQSVLFIVEESGSGNEETLGDFTYATSLLQNLARIPPGCSARSSTGVDGFAILSFADDQIWLKRISGTACFALPTINVEEQWRIASGTGTYVGATGKLSRHLIGNVISGTAFGTISGTIKFD